jgi:hypothetical protein
MSLKGGGLNAHDIFKNILSIGFEFETHDLAKLSLHQNGKTLINSDISLRVVKTKMATGDIKIADDNYLLIKIPIILDKESKVEDVDEHMNELQQDFLEEFEDLEEEDTKDVSYLEYLNENRKDDNKETIKFQDTNDIGDVGFGDMLEKECDDLKIPKNNMYFFKANSGKMFDIKFSESMEMCKTFSGLEFVVTYYKPKQNNPNILVDTFVDACSRIIDHFGNLKKTSGSLMIKKGKNEFKTIGQLEGNRRLYNKPGTNLFYMDTYDTDKWKKGRATRTPKDAVFIPQMTFKSNALHTLDIIKELVNKDARFKVGRNAIEQHGIEYDDVIRIEKMVDNIIEVFNKTASRKISSTNGMGKVLKFYLFLFFYKLTKYVEYHSKILFGEDDYLKDYLSFSSRHTNYTLYMRIKEIMAEHYDVTRTKELVAFFYQPEILKSMYELSEFTEDDYDENGEYKYTDADVIDLPKRSKNYGDPMYSLRSYFTYFEDPVTKKKGDRDYETANDWFVDSGIDIYSTMFDLKNDEVLIENRYFRYEIGLWLRNNVSQDIHTDELSIREMFMLVNSLYGKNTKKLMTLEDDPISHKLTKKCKDGYKRSKNFECVKTKKSTKTKKPAKTVKRAKVIRSKTMKEPMMA